MRKTRFFYRNQLFLAVLLAWLSLMNEAVLLHMDRKEAEPSSVEAEETDLQEAGKKTGMVEELQTRHGAEQKKESREDPDIRVLLMDNGCRSYYHSSVTVSYGGETHTYTPDSRELENGPLRIDAGEEGIQVASIQRQEGSPVYEGCLEVKRAEEGILLINILPLETYLEGVVPSEMPASYDEEALKAQAVCARTYARKQMQESRLKEYGADVDDSVNFQVYQNIPPKERTSEAVQETRGEVLCQNGELIEAYYFSTSSGATSTDEIWGAEEPAAYLKSVACTFDAGEPWSRWSVEIPWKYLEGRAQELTGSSEALTGIEITKKNQSGAVTGLNLVMETETCEVSGEYGVREYLSPKDCVITENDGSQVQGFGLLPSSYFSMEADTGNCIFLTGGGYGHGVGMSQNGANQMAMKGYTYREILNYFFKDIEIREM